MRELIGGIVVLAAWALLTFAVHPDTGWIHLLLIAGVLLVIRGIVMVDEHAQS